MSILRSEHQVALLQLFRLAQESVDHYQDSAEFVADDSAKQLFKRIAFEREQLAVKLAQAIRDTGDLPAPPDPDLEAGEQLFHRLHAWFTADQTQDVLEQRFKAEQDLEQKLRERQIADPDETYQGLIRDLLAHVENASAALRHAMP